MFNPRLSVVPGSPAVPGSLPPAMTPDDSSASAGSLYSSPHTNDAGPAPASAPIPIPLSPRPRPRTPSAASDTSARSLTKRLSQVIPFRRGSRSPSVHSRMSGGPPGSQVHNATADTQMLRGMSNTSDGSKKSNSNNRLSRIFIRPRTTSASRQGSINKRDREGGGSARRKSQFVVPTQRLEDIFMAPVDSPIQEPEPARVVSASRMTDAPLSQSPTELISVRRVEDSETEPSSSSAGDLGRLPQPVERRRPTKRISIAAASQSSSLDAVTAQVQGVQPLTIAERFVPQGQAPRRASRASRAVKLTEDEGKSSASGNVPVPRSVVPRERDSPQEHMTGGSRNQVSAIPPRSTSTPSPPPTTIITQPPVTRTFLVQPPLSSNPTPAPAANIEVVTASPPDRRTQNVPAHVPRWRASIARHHRDAPPAPVQVPPSQPAVPAIPPPARLRLTANEARPATNQLQVPPASGPGSSSVDVSSAGETTDAPPVLIPPPQPRTRAGPREVKATVDPEPVPDPVRTAARFHRDTSANDAEPSPLLLDSPPERPKSPPPRDRRQERWVEPQQAPFAKQRVEEPTATTRQPAVAQITPAVITPDRPGSTRPQESRGLRSVAVIPAPQKEARVVEQPTPAEVPPPRPSSPPSQEIRPTPPIVQAPAPQRVQRVERPDRSVTGPTVVSVVPERPSSPPPQSQHHRRPSPYTAVAQRDTSVDSPSRAPAEVHATPAVPPERPLSPRDNRYASPGERAQSRERNLRSALQASFAPEQPWSAPVAPQPQRATSPPPPAQSGFRPLQAAPSLPRFEEEVPRSVQQSVSAIAPPPPRPSSPRQGINYRNGNGSDAQVLTFGDDRNQHRRAEALSPILVEAQLRRGITPRLQDEGYLSASESRPDVSQQPPLSDSDGPDLTLQTRYPTAPRSHQKPSPPPKELTNARQHATTSSTPVPVTSAARHVADHRRMQTLESSPDVISNPVLPQRTASPPPQPDRSRKPTAFIRPHSPDRPPAQSDSALTKDQLRMRRIPPPASTRNAPSTPASRTVSVQNQNLSQASTPMIPHPPMPTRPSEGSPRTHLLPPPVPSSSPGQSPHSYKSPQSNPAARRHATVTGAPELPLPPRPRTPIRAATAPISITHPGVLSRVRFDEHRKPSREQLSYAESLFVIAENGIRVRFGDLWQNKKTIVCFIRHFWYVILSCVTIRLFMDRLTGARTTKTT
jgi:hypothetical protein